MRMLRSGLALLFGLLVCSTAAIAQYSAAPSQSVLDSGQAPSGAPAQSSEGLPAAALTLNTVLDHVVEREHYFMAQMRHMHPMVETYLQDLKSDGSGNTSPVKDQYFLGRLDMTDGPEDVSFVGQPGFGHRMLSKLTGVYSLHYLPMGFAQMVVLDTDFQKRYYKFNFVRREFLGEVRCLVIDVQPRDGEKTARFLGRIWVEDQDYNIVRFNGTYYPQPKINFFFHFDSWRLNMARVPGFRLMSTAKSPTCKTGRRVLHFKAQTRLWGYDVKDNKNEEFTQIWWIHPSL